MRFLDLFPPPEYLIMKAVGVDISDRSLKFVEFYKEEGKLRLKRFGEENMEEGIVENGEIKNKARLISFLKKIKKIHNFIYVVLSLPEEKAFLSLVELPQMPNEQIRTSLALQIEEYIPLRLEDVIFDFEINPSHERKDHLDVLLLAFPKKLVFDYYEAFEEAGFMPVAMELESLSIARSLIPDNNKDSVMIIDFGKNRTTFSILKGGSLRFTSTIFLGGRDLEKMISKALGISLFAAEKAKKDFSLLGHKTDKRIYEAILPVISSIKDEIEKHQLYWRNHPLHAQSAEKQKIKEIILVGGESNMTGLPEYLSQELSMPVRIGNPWLKIDSFDNYVPEITKRESLSYSVAIGLALRGLRGE